jgi:hypothetical protein
MPLHGGKHIVPAAGKAMAAMTTHNSAKVPPALQCPKLRKLSQL